MPDYQEFCFMKIMKWLMLLLVCVWNHASVAASPREIRIGTLYASSGPFSSSSLPEYQGLLFWVHQVNGQGGPYIRAYHKRIPIRLIAYNDQSQTGLAGALYNQLLTKDHVRMLVSDFGSVLTSVAVPLARVHHVLLFDVTGTSSRFFNPDNPYIVLTSLPTSGVWPDALAGFLIHQKIRRVAMVYSTNDFDASQAETLRHRLQEAGVKLVYDHGVPSSTSTYSILIHRIAMVNPSAVIEFGYPDNDLAFLQDLASNDVHFKMVFTVFPGQLLHLFKANLGRKLLAWVYTYPTPPLLAHTRINYGPALQAFVREYEQHTGRPVNFLTVAGYNAGLVIQRTLAVSQSLKALAMRRAINGFSGRLKTLDGEFKVKNDGSQIGELLPVGQLQLVRKGLRMTIVYPEPLATGTARYPAPSS